MFDIRSPLGFFAMQEEMDELDFVGRLQNASDEDDIQEILETAEGCINPAVIDSVCRKLQIKGA